MREKLPTSFRSLTPRWKGVGSLWVYKSKFRAALLIWVQMHFCVCQQYVNSLNQALVDSLDSSGVAYRGTSLTRKRTPLGPYRKSMPRVLGGWEFSHG